MNNADSLSALTVEQRTAAAEGIAEAARHLYGLQTPIDPLDWCRLAGVALQWQTQFEEGRYLRPVNEPPSILIREEQRGRRRSHFTVAHELGHHLVEETRRNAEMRNLLSDRVLRNLSRIATASNEEERLCDEIAGALLLPIETVRGVRRLDGKPCLSDLLDMATKHQTSHAATLVRFRRISGTEMAYALCERARDPNSNEHEWFVIDQQNLGIRLPPNAWLRPVWAADQEHEDSERDYRGYAMWYVPTTHECVIVWTDWQRLRGGRYAVLVMEAPDDASTATVRQVCQSRMELRPITATSPDVAPLNRS